MPDLIPVEGNPFNVNLVPVEGDPFALQGDVGAAMQQQNAVEAQRRATAGGLLQHFMTPGRVAQGVQPETPGVMTEADAFRQNQLEDQANNWAPQQAMNMIGTGVPMSQAGALGAAGGGIKAWHASPHDFEKFDISKVGTGEGAQAFGHGLYNAENPAVSGPLGQYDLAFTSQKLGHSLSDQEFNVLKAIRSGKTDQEILKEFPEDVFKRVNEAKAKLYYNSINADPEHFLDWDKPLSEQHPVVQRAIMSKGQENNTGMQAYQNASLQLGSMSNLTEELRKAGVPGIRYLDQGSRGPSTIYNVGAPRSDFGPYSPFTNRADAQAHMDMLRRQGFHDAEIREQAQPQTSNYVVFNDKLIDIIKKYGLAGLVAGGASHFTTTPVEHNPFAAQQ